MIEFNNILSIIFASLRTGGMLVAMPVLGMNAAPAVLKILLSFIIGASMVRFIGTIPADAFYHNEIISVLVIRELAIGLFVGLCARLVFAVVSMTLEYASVQMGFSMANIFDPSSFSQVTVLGQIGMIMSVLVFFTTNMHHHFFAVIAKSYSLMPVAMPDFDLAPMAEMFIGFVKKVFEVALRISMPVIVVMLLVHTVLGIIAKAAPQMNLFFNVAIIVNVVVGIVLIVLLMPQILQAFVNVENIVLNGLTS